MKKTLYLLVALFLFSACETKIPDKKSPEGAFRRLSACIDSASTECLFGELDSETRWTVSSIYKILQEMKKTVNKSYPDDDALRNSVFGKWHKMAAVKNDVEMFSLLCQKSQCLQHLARGFGAVRELKKDGDEAELTTVRDETFLLRRVKGKWGIVLLDEMLKGEQTRLSDTLRQVKRNAAEYEQQRLATGRK
ncbi:MAG: hypothetical protein JXR76_23120 [Deltaproteobacteria bacterium]|nr:hypothetical protein [Deltaproteobacteria bacterium]